MITSFEELVTEDVYKNTMSLLSQSLDKGVDPTIAFSEAVFYAQNAMGMSKGKIEKSLAITLSDLFEDSDNPFKGIISVILLPWYIKTKWRFEANIKRNKKAIIIGASLMAGILLVTNPSISDYRQHVALKYNISERAFNFRIITARKANFFLFSIYGNNRNGTSLGILGNFFDF